MSDDSTGKPALYASMIADEAAVQAKITELAAQVVERYAGKDPLFVCLLRGGAPFATDLMKAIARRDPQFHPELDYMTVKTYGDARSDKAPFLVLDVAPTTCVKDRKVVMLDDTLDKGVTAQFAEQHLMTELGAASVDLVVLVQKNRPRSAYGDASLYGFSIEGSTWLTGMGLDDANIGPEANRWAGFIAIANPEE